jgi:membrane-bound ClpP family serine protease
MWWYIAILVVGFFLGLTSIYVGHTTLALWAYVVAILLGCIVAPFSLCLYGLLGGETLSLVQRSTLITVALALSRSRHCGILRTSIADYDRPEVLGPNQHQNYPEQSDETCALRSTG